jgi:hypothetical protein
MPTSAESRAAKILSIIENRKPIAEKTTKTIKQLNIVKSSLESFARFLPTVLEKEIPDENKAKIKELQSDLKKLTEVDILQCSNELTQLKHRFSRSTLNIGVVGNARQGKSTFLQALTGLSSNEIPSAVDGHCTGAPSIIINAPETYADIEFYNESDFMREVIFPYYTKLELTPQPNSFSSFADTPLPKPTEEFNATEVELYKRLNIRQKNCQKYRNYLNQRQQRISKGQIREYIAQQNKDKTLIFKWVAVKMATIYCPFQVQDAGKISVCDTPGLGDFVCGADENLTRNIADNLDAVLLLKLVPDGGIVKTEDTQLYDLIPKAIPEFSPKDWSYFIINRKDSDNDSSVNYFEKQLIESAIKVRKIIKVNASRVQDVLTSFDQILEDIKSNQKSLDETLYKKRFENVETLIRNIKDFIGKAKDALKEIGKDSLPLLAYQSLFDTCWNKISNSLENDIKQKYRLKRDAADPELEEKIDSIKEEATKLILDKLNKITPAQYAGSRLGSFAFELQHDLRIELANAFDALDNNLESEFTELRQSIVNVLRNKEKGSLDGILNEKFQDCSAEEWLAELANCFQEIPNSDKIVSSIRALISS